MIGFHDVRVSSRAQCTLPPFSFSVLGAQYGTHGSLCTVGAPYIFSGGLNLVDAWQTLLSLSDHMVSATYMVASHRAGCALGFNMPFSFSIPLRVRSMLLKAPWLLVVEHTVGAQSMWQEWTSPTLFSSWTEHSGQGYEEEKRGSLPLSLNSVQCEAQIQSRSDSPYLRVQ